MPNPKKWEDLTRSEQAVLAHLPEDVDGFAGAFDSLAAAGLVDAYLTTTTRAGLDLLGDAVRRGFLYDSFSLGYFRIRGEGE